MKPKSWSFLQAGDRVDLVAPASRHPQKNLEETIQLLKDWQLKVNHPKDLYGDDLLCANSDEKRFEHLKEALLNSDSKAVIAVRGGYGATRLLPQLLSLNKPSQSKLFIGMSDITALHIFLQQQWGWSTLHSAVAPFRFSDDSIEKTRKIIFGETKVCHYSGLSPINSLAKQKKTISSTLVGGNLCLVQASLGTSWQLDTTHKILFLEEVSERGYRIDRMIEHLKQAGLFKEVDAVIFGDFLDGKEPNGSSLVEPVLKRFAENCSFPVLQYKGIGHDFINEPLPLNTSVRLHLDSSANLECDAGSE